MKSKLEVNIMRRKIEKIIDSAYLIEFSTPSKKQLLIDLLDQLADIIDENHYVNRKIYLNEIDSLESRIEEFSIFDNEQEWLRIQRGVANIARRVYEENKQIFVVHGRDLSMRSNVCALLGKLKLDYVVLESEHNSGTTVIEKFTKHASECGYAIVLFSPDDVGGLNAPEPNLKARARQNVILELGYFLGTIGRKNIAVLHHAGSEIERPSDFDGIVYAPYDEFGAWKTKLIKEMSKAGIYIDLKLAERA